MEEIEVVRQAIESKLMIPKQAVAPVLERDSFQESLDSAKLQILDNAQQHDSDFVHKIQEELKQAALKSAQLEKEKQELEKQAIEYRQELLETQQLKNKQVQDSDYWKNRQERRQYHYDGVKDLMLFINVKQPMNLIFLYVLTILVMPFYLVHKFIKGTLGAIISGADSADRSKAVKAFLWTLLAVFFVCALTLMGYLTYKWIGGL
jgi:restriction endonuclease S subunit